MASGGGIHRSLFYDVISIQNLLLAWKEFKRGKIKKKDVGNFEMDLENNLFKLQADLFCKTYVHDPYTSFYVSDPKRRHIHKASVRDRILHQAVYRQLIRIFDKHFIFDSYSSRQNKGTHKAVQRAYESCRKVSKNWKRKVWVLKCDVKKFFDSIDHNILRELVKTKVSCSDTLRLIGILLKSFEKEKGKGLPLGNVTSQLFANIYLNELDQFIKHNLKGKYYFRYCDDFIIIHSDKKYLENIMHQISSFLNTRLKLELHPNKIEIRSVNQGIDFLGYVIVPHMIVLRTKTKRRIIKVVKKYSKYAEAGIITRESFENIISSYEGILTHCRDKQLGTFLRTHKLATKST